MSLRILIADDKPLVRSGLRMLLEQHDGWTVCGEAEDGIEAFEQTNSLEPDVILLDICMPQLDGMKIMPLLRERMPNAAIVVLTMLESLDLARTAAQRGATAYITKSRLTTDLMPTLESLQARMNLPEEHQFGIDW